MTMIDVVVLLIGALAGWTGWRAGGVHSLVGVLGRVVGVATGLAVAHLIAGTSWSFGWRVAAEFAVVVLGLLVGGRLAHLVAPVPVRPSSPDRVVGLAVRTVAAVVVTAAVLAGLTLWGPAAAARATAGSWTVATAAPQLSSLAAELRGSLPADLDGVVPSAAPTSVGGDAALTATQAAATVQVLAGQAGGSATSTGSGFVVSGSRVVTAHHVVADASSVTVVAGGTRYDATVVVDDARSDVAVLTVSGLGVTPVSVTSARVAAGAAVVFAGYPGGGPLQAGAATVEGGVAMPTANSSGVGLRPAYRLAADVRPGNSGGPVFAADGRVVAMVDARSLTTANTGFALTAEPVLAALAAS